MTTDPETAAAKLEAARENHAAAIAKHAEAGAKASRASERHREVAGQRQAMLERVAAGQELDATDLARARDALAEAADIAAIHHAAWQGTQKAVYHAEIALAHATVAGFDTRKAAFQDVDAAMDDVRAALVRGQAQLDRLRQLSEEAKRDAMQNLPDLLRRNPVLAARHASEHPKMQAPNPVRMDLTALLIRDDRGSQQFHDETPIRQPLAQMFASLAPAGPADAA